MLTPFLRREHAALRALATWKIKKTTPDEDSFDESDDESDSGNGDNEAAREEKECQSEIPILTTREASKILRRGKNKSWVLRRNEDGDLRISVKTDHTFQQIRLHEREDNKFSRLPDGPKLSMQSLLGSLVSLNGTCGKPQLRG